MFINFSSSHKLRIAKMENLYNINEHTHSLIYANKIQKIAFI